MSPFYRSPRPYAGSSPSPLLLGRAAKTPTTTRRDVVVRFLCMKFCAFARKSDEKLLGDDEHRETRRPSLEDLLRMEEEASSSPSCPEHQNPQDTVSCCFKDNGVKVASPAVPISASLQRAILQALRMDMGRTKGRYRKLAGSSHAAGKAELLFYQRPIPMGRRCRVQHLEESPYV